MGCGCNKAKSGATFLWTSSDGKDRKTLTSEVQAKAQVIKAGGSFTVKTA